MKKVKKTFVIAINLLLRKIKLIFYVLFSSQPILEQRINEDLLILIPSKNKNEALVDFILDKNSLIKAVNITAKRKHNLNVKQTTTAVHKNQISIKVSPLTTYPPKH